MTRSLTQGKSNMPRLCDLTSLPLCTLLSAVAGDRSNSSVSDRFLHQLCGRGIECDLPS